MPAARRRRHRVVWWAVGVVGVLVLAWVVFAVAVVGHPTLAERPQRADAIVVLGPSNKRVPQAVTLADRLGIDQLVLSIGDFPQQTGTCSQPGLEVHCFVPDPYDTSGEARAIGAMAAKHGWRDLIVVTAVPQASRARLLIGRCFSGRLQMVADQREDLGWTGWVWQAAYQTGGFVKAALHRSC